MPTDNWPVQFRYISRRLVRETAQQHEAGQGAFGGAIDLDVDLGGVGSVTAQRRPPDYANPLDLALRATAAVRGLTGAIDQPDAYRPVRNIGTESGAKQSTSRALVSCRRATCT